MTELDSGYSTIVRIYAAEKKLLSWFVKWLAPPFLRFMNLQLDPGKLSSSLTGAIFLGMRVPFNLCLFCNFHLFWILDSRIPLYSNEDLFKERCSEGGRGA